MSYTGGVSLDRVPTQDSAKVTCCDKCCIRLSAWQLQVINFVDFVLGSVIMYFAFMLYDKIGNEAFINPSLG